MSELIEAIRIDANSSREDKALLIALVLAAYDHEYPFELPIGVEVLKAWADESGYRARALEIVTV